MRNPFASQDDLRWNRGRKFFLGSISRRGFLLSFSIYGLLFLISFIFLYPMLHMISQSLMSSEDLLSSTASWIPASPTMENYTRAFKVMNYGVTLAKTLYLVGVSTVCQVFICSFVGYGFARYQFPTKKLLMGILLLSYLLPVQATSMPNYILLKSLNLTDGTIKPFLITSLLGQGVKSALCILIFYNFHRQVPKALSEAAQIDGAGHIRTYFQIAVPLALPAIIVVALFSFVWYWNDVYLTGLYLGSSMINNTSLTTVMVKLNGFEDSIFASEHPLLTFAPRTARPGTTMTEATVMSATMLAILPLFLFYACLQKYFVESIDHVGITGE